MIDADLVAWTYSEGGVDIATIAKWHERPKTEIAKCLPLAEILERMGYGIDATGAREACRYIHSQEE